LFIFYINFFIAIHIKSSAKLPSQSLSRNEVAIFMIVESHEIKSHTLAPVSEFAFHKAHITIGAKAESIDLSQTSFSTSAFLSPNI